MQSDAELLHQFSRTGDETAFARLVERHAPMMRGVVLRTTGDATLADEVTQTVFAILARKARSLRHEALAGWLHRTSFLEARNASRKAARYRKVLQKYQEQPMTPPADSASPAEVLPHLDHALNKLKTEERHLVVLRFYEGQSVRDIAVTTGTTEEACRKRLQRSLSRLGAVLQGRGLATSTAGLAALLAGQNLCAPPASAAVLSAAALKASPTLSTASLFTHSVSLVNAATAVKTVAAAAILAAIPVTLLWNENRDLRREIDGARRMARITDAALSSSRRNAGSEEGAVTTAAAGRARAASPGPKAEPAAPAVPVLSREVMTKLMESQREMDGTLLFNRICLSVEGLTDAQKDRLKAEVDRQMDARHAALAEVMARVDPAKLTSLDNGLSMEDSQKLAAASQPAELDEATLRSILTPEQYAQHQVAGETRRIAAAENSANDAIREMDRYTELSPEQKDQLFQKLADSELRPDEAAADPARAMEKRDAIMRSVLTPQQAAVYDETREKEKQTFQKMLQLIPGLGDLGQTPANP